MRCGVLARIASILVLLNSFRVDEYLFMVIREATAADAATIARLHADSWQIAYRGILTDEFLDKHAHRERLTLWQERFSPASHTPGSPQMFVLLAEQGAKPVGFSSVFVEDDPLFGSLLDNLHVAPEITRQGIGRQLLSESARRLLADRSHAGLYLWVIDKNQKARNFYGKAGATFVDSVEHDMPDGSRVVALRCYWPDPASLVL
jgi:ribosomal protein S18 acetylase RimI-like enzyme